VSKVTGSGITTRRYLSAKDDPEEFINSLGIQTDFLEEKISLCKTILDESPIKISANGCVILPEDFDGYKPFGSELWYAVETLKRAERAMMYVAQGDAKNAAQQALHLGMVLREAELKFRWERHALKSFEQENRSREKKAANKKVKQQLAIEEYERNLRIEGNKTAAYLSCTLGSEKSERISDSRQKTIRRYIEKAYKELQGRTPPGNPDEI